MNTNENTPHSFALDNISITSCDYPPTELSPDSSLLSLSCDFDDLTMCDMTNGDAHSIPTYNFTVLTGDTIPNNTLAPLRDHTTNSTSGGFLYWNRTYPFSGRDYGVINPSKSMEQNTGMCVKFAYYVKSEASGKNGTKLTLSTGGCSGAWLWSIGLDDSDGWQTVIIPLEVTACDVTFYFNVVQSEVAEVAVAFDDIEIDQCSTVIPTTTSTTTTTSTSTTTTTTTVKTSSTSTTTQMTTTTSIPTTTTTTASTTTPSSAHQLLFFNGYCLILISIFFRMF